MKANDRVKSQYNEGTIESVSAHGEGTVVVRWDGFGEAIEIPAALAVTFEVVGFVDPDELPEPNVGSREEFPLQRGGQYREDFHSDG